MSMSEHILPKRKTTKNKWKEVNWKTQNQMEQSAEVEVRED